MTGPRVLLSGGRGAGPEVEGEALVSQQGFGIRYDLDPATGLISNRDHDLCGQSIAGKILVFRAAKGGVAASWALADLKDRGLAPLGLVFERASPIFVQGALFAEMAIMHGFDQSACAVLTTGMRLRLRPHHGFITFA